ncbi:MAG: nucleoside triphosphate pyrophosphatase [Phycisphaerae bacterium]|jgi:septum formation protein
MNGIKKQSFILASASPRRKELLEKAGYKFDIVVSDVDESKISTAGIDSAEFTRRAALAKAKDVAEKFPDRLVVAADTVVDYEGQIIGKPDSAKHAEEIIRKLFSKPHKVITGIAFVKKDAGLEFVDCDITTVYPKKMTEKQIAEHIASQTWQGKAGAYGIQDGADEFVEKIEGSYTNVMGLSMELLERMFGKIS